MTEPSLRILQVNTADNRGGAAQVAWNLHQAYRERGIQAGMAVGRKFSTDPTVAWLLDDETGSRYVQPLLKAICRLSILHGRVHDTEQLGGILWGWASPRRLWNYFWGLEDFHHPTTRRLLGLFPETPNIVHCHNLHGKYFDLRILPWLSRQIPIVLTLHDAWLLSGHCAHSFGCERWKIGCGHCPDLTITPAIRRDATAYNWRQKQEIYAKSQFYVATPGQWLMHQVEQSILAPAIVEARVIPNGVDLSVFQPADKSSARLALDIPQDARILLFTADGIQQKIFKDYQTMRAAVALVAERLHGQKVLFIALGEDAPVARIGRAEIRFIPYQKESMVVANYYQAADVYVHAARADTFPNAVLEALACGTPVVATAVGGIPEQVKSLAGVNLPMWQSSAEATGILTPPGDAEAMAAAVMTLLINDPLCRQLGENAAQDARRRFDLNRQVETYLDWYQTIVERWQREKLNRPTYGDARSPYALSYPG